MKDNNEFITWNEKLTSGINLIDDQHRKLVEYFNEMSSFINSNDAQEHDYFRKLIQEVLKYIKIHFATEENIMLVANFDGLAEHKKVHNSLLLAIIENDHDYEFKKHLTPTAFTKLFKDWLLSHIDIMDRQYFDYFKKLSSRKGDTH